MQHSGEPCCRLSPEYLLCSLATASQSLPLCFVVQQHLQQMHILTCPVLWDAKDSRLGLDREYIAYPKR